MLMMGRSLVSADVSVIFPRDRGATRVARIVAYWYLSFGSEMV